MIVLMTIAKKSISSCEFAEQLNLNQRTAWSMQMKIRKAMKEKDEILSHIIDAEEIYVGARGKWKKKDRWPDKKIPVVGVITHLERPNRFWEYTLFPFTNWGIVTRKPAGYSHCN